ncbi:MAG: hypothetical protein M3R24_15970 [Chloroflexota bacterium]|nr:hypothetical protein [Chloroflexota bacterium]
MPTTLAVVLCSLAAIQRQHPRPSLLLAVVAFEQHRDKVAIEIEPTKFLPVFD